MAIDDRQHWDGRYAELGLAPADQVTVLPVFAEYADVFPASGTALEVACGRGRGAVWLADRGMDVTGYDVSPVAIDLARQLADSLGLADRCAFAVADFDDGLPAGEQVDLVLCHLFRDARLDRALIDRLRVGGLLAVAVLSEVGAAPGRFRTAPGELVHAFSDLEPIAHDEADGVAWLLGRRTG